MNTKTILSIFTIICILAVNNLFSQDDDKFLTAAAKGDLAKVSSMVKKGTDVNTKNNLKWTALSYAAKYGHLSIVEFLVEKGANINYKNNTGFTPMLIAYLNNQSEVLEFLVEKGADPNIPDMVGMSVLAYAVKENKIKVVKLLIEKAKADINIKNSSGRTPMDIVADEEIKKYLKSKGGKTGKELLAD